MVACLTTVPERPPPSHESRHTRRRWRLSTDGPATVGGFSQLIMVVLACARISQVNASIPNCRRSCRRCRPGFAGCLQLGHHQHHCRERRRVARSECRDLRGGRGQRDQRDDRSRSRERRERRREQGGRRSVERALSSLAGLSGPRRIREGAPARGRPFSLGRIRRRDYGGRKRRGMWR